MSIQKQMADMMDSANKNYEAQNEKLAMIEESIADLEAKYKVPQFNTPETREEAKESKMNEAMEMLTSFVKQEQYKDFGKYCESKATESTDTARATIPELISSRLIEHAIDNDALLAQCFRDGTTSDRYTVPYLSARPEVAQSLENKDGSVPSLLDGQEYESFAARWIRMRCSTFMSDQVLAWSSRSVVADFLRTGAEDIGQTFAELFLHSDGTASTDNLEGMLNDRLDKANNYSNALLPDATRPANIYRAMKTGILGNLPADDQGIINLLIDVQASIPSRIRMEGNCKWFMNKNTLARLRKVVDADGRPLFDMFSDAFGSILGDSVILVDQIRDIDDANAETLLIYGDMRKAGTVVDFSGLNKQLVDPYYAHDGVKVSLYQGMGSVMGQNDAITCVVGLV